MNKVLIIAAHPDDDILGCAGLMSKYRGKVEFRVIFIADGSSCRFNKGDINNEKVSPFAEVQSKTVFDMVAQMYKLIIILMFKTKIRVKKYSINPCQYI